MMKYVAFNRQTFMWFHTKEQLANYFNITVAYLKDEIAGFAVHFNQK